MAIDSRGTPTITPDKARDANKLFQYLGLLERQISRIIEEVRLGNTGDAPVHLDFREIRDALSAGGRFPLSIEGLVGVAADAQLAGILISTTEPSVNSYPVGTLLVLTGTPDTFKYLKAGTPNTWQAISMTPANMMTTDTNQAPGATVVKTWTAIQVFNGGLTAGGKVHITAGGLEVDAGGIIIDLGGLDINAGGASITGNSEVIGTFHVDGDLDANNIVSDGRTTTSELKVGGGSTMTFITHIGLSLTPALVAANTTAEQTFACAGALVNDAVTVNKPTHQAGLGIVGCRISAADTLAITFCNVTGAGITPTAGEVYEVVLVR